MIAGKLIEKQNRNALLQKLTHSWSNSPSSLTTDNSTLYPSKYIIEDQIFSPATRVIFPTDHNVCLKIWIPCDNGLYSTEDLSIRTQYLLEGLAFNRRFAKDVYLGITPVVIPNDKEIHYGSLIKKPVLDTLQSGVEYALLMKRLRTEWRLDYILRLLREDKLCSTEKMELLAGDIVQMHAQLKPSPNGEGTPVSLKGKLTRNTGFFEKALQEIHYDKPRFINDVMFRAYDTWADKFKQRYEEGHIKRCHGDLKATNLWLRPTNAFNRDWKNPRLKKRHWQLLALDCVDFDPDFCNIDTLSDIAMLAIDIEMRLTSWQNEGAGQWGKNTTQHFIHTYLKQAGEDKSKARSILEYYMTEKAMVCAYMCILFDGLPTLGKKYLEIAISHAHNLERMLRKSASKKSADMSILTPI